MEYQARLIARKREFEGKEIQPHSENGTVTTIPAPLGWNYTRSYHPRLGTYLDPKPLPCEIKKNFKLLSRFEY